MSLRVTARDEVVHRGAHLGPLGRARLTGLDHQLTQAAGELLDEEEITFAQSGPGGGQVAVDFDNQLVGSGAEVALHSGHRTPSVPSWRLAVKLL